MTGCIGVFMISTGFRFEKPRPGNPCGVWAAGNYRGIRGFISTAGKFFKNDHRGRMSNQKYQQLFFPATEKNHRNPKNPVEAV